MTSDLKICLIAPEFIPLWGGAGSYTVQLIKNLPKELEIHVVTLKRFLKNEDNVYRKAEKIPDFGNNVQIHYISTAKDTFLYNASFQASCLRSIPKLHKEYHFDLIHSHHAHMSDLLLKLTGVVRIPTVVTVHNMLRWMRRSILSQGLSFDELDRSEKGILLFYPMLKRLEHFYLDSTQKLIAPSVKCQDELTSYLDMPKEKISVVYNGVDPNLFLPDTVCTCLPNESQLRDHPIVLFVGRLVAQKGLETLAKTIPRVVKRFKDVLFLFVGQGDFSHLSSQIEGDGVSRESFLNIGYASHADIAQIYTLASVFVLPSPHENCSISLLEAMSCERAVVAANVGGNPEVVRNYYNGVLFSSGNSDQLAGIIIQLLEDASLRRKLGLQARKTVIERFSASHMADQTAQVYRKILVRNIS